MDNLINVIVSPNENSLETHHVLERQAEEAQALAGDCFYQDGERFARVYTDHEKATGFAERQKKSPVVTMARVTQLS